MEKNKTRQFERYGIRRKIAYRPDSATDYSQGLTTNISKTGMLLKTREPVDKGAALELVMKVRDTAVHFKGSCVYCLNEGPETFHSGVRIGKINTGGMEPFLSFMKSLEKSKQESGIDLSSETMDNVVLRISGEHKIITHYVMALQEMMKDQAPCAEPAEFEAILNLLRKDLSTHFDIEEKMFFKLALVHMPPEFHGMVFELTEEHALLNRELDRLINSVEGFSRTNALLSNSLKTGIKAFLEEVKQHAKKEITGLFSAMEENARITSKLKQALQAAVNG